MIRLPQSLAGFSFRDGNKPPWRWLAAGLGAGFVLGAVGVRVLTRGRRDADRPVVQTDDHPDSETETQSETPSTTRAYQKRTGVAVQTVNGWTKTALHRASDTSAHAAAKVREALGHRDSESKPVPTGEARQAAKDPESAVNPRDS